MTILRVKRHLLVSFLLILSTLIVYGPSLSNEFVNYDDDIYVTENSHVQQGFTSESMAWAFTAGYAGNWHPLTWLSHMLDYSLFGLKSWGHHLTNLLLHLTNTLLLFYVLRRMTGVMWQSALVALLFAVHPLHVESVAWIAERKDLLSTTFFMLIVWSYTYYVEHSGAARYLLTLALFALGLMAKPMLVSIPFVLLLLDFWPLKRIQFLNRAGNESSRSQTTVIALGRRTVPLRILREKLPFIVLAIASSIVTFVVQQRGGAVSSLDRLPVGTRISNASITYAAYIGKMFWPSDLAVFYPHPGNTLPLWQAIIAGLLVVFLSVFFILRVRQRPYLLVGWFWYVGTLVPVIGIVQVGDQSMADRYTYIPLIGLFIIVVWGISDLLRRWQMRPSLVALGAIVLLFALGVRARSQLSYWRDSITLFEHTISVTKDNWLFHNNVAVMLGKEGKIKEAITHLREAIRIKPYYAEAHNNLAITLSLQGNTIEAITHFSEAIKHNPDFENAHFNLALALTKEKRLGEAIEQYQETLRINPNNKSAREELERAIRMKGERL